MTNYQNKSVFNEKSDSILFIKKDKLKIKKKRISQGIYINRLSFFFKEKKSVHPFQRYFLYQFETLFRENRV